MKLSPDHIKAIIMALFGAIAAVCLVCLFLPTNLELRIPQEGNYTVSVQTGLNNYVVPIDYIDGPQTITVGGFSVTSIIRYPNYYAGLLGALIISCIGFLLSTRISVVKEVT